MTIEEIEVVFLFFKCVNSVFGIVYFILLIATFFIKDCLLNDFSKLGMNMVDTNPYRKMVMWIVKLKIVKLKFLEKDPVLPIIVIAIYSAIPIVNIYLVHLLIRDVNHDL